MVKIGQTEVDPNASCDSQHQLPVTRTVGSSSQRMSWFMEGQPARICFIVAFVAFSAAGAGWAVNHFLTGWMEVAGMVAVGLFYLGLGLLELGRRSSI